MLLWIVKKLKKLPALNVGTVASSVPNWKAIATIPATANAMRAPACTRARPDMAATIERPAARASAVT